MSEKIVVANWKMNGDMQSIRDLMSSFTHIRPVSKSPVVICPPFVYTSFVLHQLAEIGWLMGAQDCASTTDGAYTGDISCSMLKQIGCHYVIVGHSERRQHHLETNQTIREKMYRCFDNDLTPILCIGETETQYIDLSTMAVLQQQLEECLPASEGQNKPFMIAYEPIWAIGTGKVAQPSEIVSVHQNIKSLLKNINTGYVDTPILYGGSVNAQNADEILSLDEVDGVLVGGASLKARDFLKIVEGASYK